MLKLFAASSFYIIILMVYNKNIFKSVYSKIVRSFSKIDLSVYDTQRYSFRIKNYVRSEHSDFYYIFKDTF